MKKLKALRFTLTTLFSVVVLGASAIASGPQGFSYSGEILDPNGAPVENASVQFVLQIRSPGAESCVLFEESHLVNMTGSDGHFSLKVGSGTRTGSNFKDVSTVKQVFDNSSNVISALNCASGTTYDPTAGDARRIRLSFDAGAGVQTVTQDHVITSVPYASYADSLQGKSAADLVQTIPALESTAGLTQSRFNRVINTDYATLDQLIAGTSPLYARATPIAAVSYNNQRLTNVADPAAASDVATKNYSDTYVGARQVDFSAVGAGVGDGRIMTWNAAANRWEATLPAAGGDFRSDGTIPMTAALRASAGTATAPSISFNASTSSGLFTSGGGVGISTTGASRLFVDSSGNVGVGTTAPLARLHVANGGLFLAPNTLPSGSAGLIAIDSGDSNRLKWYNGSSWQSAGGAGATIGQTAGLAMGADAVPNCTGAQQLQMSLGPTFSWSCVTDAPDKVSRTGDTMTGMLSLPTNGLNVGTNQLTVAGGYVGIGTATPSTALTVQSISSEAIPLTITRANGVASNTVGMNFKMQNSAAANVVYGSVVSGILTNTAATHSGFLGFHTTSAGATAEKMRLDANGRLMLGTISPVAKFTNLNQTSDPSTGQYTTYSAHELNLSANNSVSNSGIYSDFKIAPAAGITQSGTNAGVTSNSVLYGPGTINSMRSFDAIHGSISTGVVTSSIGYYGRASATGGTITNSYGLLLDTPIISGGTITNRYGIYQADDLATNILRGGTVIGEPTVPTSRLTISTSSASDIAQLALYNSTTGTPDVGSSLAFRGASGTVDMASIGGLWSTASQGDAYMAFRTRGGGVSLERMRLTSTGNLGVGTTSPSERVHIMGNLRVQGSTDCTLGNGSAGTSCSSDARLKNDISRIQNPLEKISSLRGVEFNWNEKSNSPGRHDIGVIAQDVEKVFPTAVTRDPASGYRKVDYAVLVSPLIEAVKALYSKVLGNDERLKSLEAENAALKEAICELNPNAKVCSAH